MERLSARRICMRSESSASFRAYEYSEGRASVAFQVRCRVCTDSHSSILCSAVENLEPFLKPGANVLDVGTFLATLSLTRIELGRA